MSIPPSRKDGFQILQYAYDDISQRLRVDATISASGSDIEISAADGDNIAISDGVNTANVNPDGSLNVTITGGALDAEIDAADGDNIAISDGTNTLAVNPDGSLNVVTDSPGNIAGYYNEVTSVPAAILTNILSYTAITTGYLEKIVVAGTNMAQYDVTLNGTPIDKRYTYFTNLNCEFDFQGLEIQIGDIIIVRVLHNRPTVGDFNARINISEI